MVGERRVHAVQQTRIEYDELEVSRRIYVFRDRTAINHAAKRVKQPVHQGRVGRGRFESGKTYRNADKTEETTSQRVHQHVHFGQLELLRRIHRNAFLKQQLRTLKL